MKVILVKSVLMEESGTVTVLGHPDDYEVLKKGFEVVSGAFSEVLAEPLLASPPEVVTDVVDAKEGCSHDFMPSPILYLTDILTLNPLTK